MNNKEHEKHEVIETLEELAHHKGAIECLQKLKRRVETDILSHELYVEEINRHLKKLNEEKDGSSRT